MKRALTILAAVALLAAAPPKAKLSLEAPAAGEYTVGQQIEIDVTGLSDVDTAKVFAFPFDTSKVHLVKVAEKSSETPPWLVWGNVPKVLFSASEAGQYLVCLQSGNDWAMVTLTVSGPRPPPALAVEPPAPLDATGPAGGPFVPPVATYTVTASGEWTAEASEPWVSVQPLADKLLVVLGPEAYTLATGTHSATVTVSCDGLNETRVVTLSVGTKPEPKPEPGPQPGPNPTPPTSLFGVIVEETKDRTPQQAQIVLSTQLRDALGGKLLLLDKDVKKIAGQDPAVIATYQADAKGKQLPVIFLTGDDPEHKGIRYADAKPLPATLEETLNLIKQIKEGGQ